MRLEAYAHQAKMRWVHEQSQGQPSAMSCLRSCNEAVAPLASFDDEGNLQLREKMYTIYTMAGLYKDKPHRTMKNQIAKRPHNVKYVYETMGTADGSPQAWLAREKERNAKLRKTNAMMARENKRRLTHTNE